MKVLAGAVRAIGAIEAAFEMVTTLLVLGIMFVVFGDVMLRYLFNKPLAWAYDLIGLYLMAGVFFLSLSGTYAAHAHVGVDILVQRLPLAWRRVSEMATRSTNRSGSPNSGQLRQRSTRCAPASYAAIAA